MSAVMTADTSALQVLTWATTFLNYTDAVIGDLPAADAALDWRPADNAGGYYFSIREQAMHIADERHDMLGWITGASREGKLFLTDYGGTGKPWAFKSGSKAEIVASLQAGRAAVDALLARPMSELLETTPGLTARFEKALADMRAAGKDEEAAKREAAGPSRVLNIVLFLIAHEQSHRSVLQTMLRQQGHNVTRYA